MIQPLDPARGVQLSSWEGGGWEANPCFVELKLFVVISCNINALPLEAFSAPGTLLREIQENLDR